MPRRTAALPGPEYTRPNRLDDSGLVVTVVGEDGTDFGQFDFSRFPEMESTRASLIHGFLKATGSDGRWRAKSSVGSGYTMIGIFLRFLESHHPRVGGMKEISPEVWWTWRTDVESRAKWPGQINVMRALLMDVPDLPELTFRALRSRMPKPRSRSYNAYSLDEFTRFKRVYTNCVEAAERRITGNVKVLIDYWNGNEEPGRPYYSTTSKKWTRGEILDHLVESGRLPDSMTVTPHLGRLKHFFGVPELQHPYWLIYPSPAEIYALAALLVCERGYNSGVAFSMEVPELSSGLDSPGGPVYTTHLDKPRRGPASRYFSNNFMGNESRLIQRAIRMTQPARHTLARLGWPTNLLSIARVSNTSRHPSGIFITDWSTSQGVVDNLAEAAPVLADDGSAIRLSLRRLRLSEQVHSQRSRQNSETVSEEIYRRNDPTTVEKALPVILQGQQDALLHAQATMEVKTVTPQDLAAGGDVVRRLSEKLKIDGDRARLLLAGTLDTATAACLDFFHSPFSSDQSGGCTASFLMCLACDNAVATPAHLPKLVALYDALQTISSIVTARRWRREFAPHFMRLKDLLDRFVTPAELDDIRRAVTGETELLVSTLLRKDLDA